MNKLLVTAAISRKLASSDFKLLLSSSLKYGLTVGTEKAKDIQLTPLGGRLTKPFDER